MAHTTSEWTDALRSSGFDTVAFLEKFYSKVRYHGGNRIDFCHSPSDHTPSCNLYLDSMSWTDMHNGQNLHGNIFDLFQEVYDTPDFVSSVRAAVDDLHLSGTIQSLLDNDPKYEWQKKRIECIEAATNFFADCRRSHSVKGQLMLSALGISQEFADELNLGYSPKNPTEYKKDFLEYMSKEGFSEDDVLYAGFLKKSRYGKESQVRFMDCLVIPEHTIYGKPSGVAFLGLPQGPDDLFARIHFINNYRQHSCDEMGFACVPFAKSIKDGGTLILVKDPEQAIRINSVCANYQKEPIACIAINKTLTSQQAAQLAHKKHDIVIVGASPNWCMRNHAVLVDAGKDDVRVLPVKVDKSLNENVSDVLSMKMVQRDSVDGYEGTVDYIKKTAKNYPDRDMVELGVKTAGVYSNPYAQYCIVQKALPNYLDEIMEKLLNSPDGIGTGQIRVPQVEQNNKQLETTKKGVGNR